MSRLDRFLSPASVCIVGASRKENSLGKAMLNIMQQMDYRGKIYPVNPNADVINDLQVYPSINALPEIPDLAIVLLPFQMVADALEQLGKFGIKNVVIISAGFREIGGEGIEREKELIKIKEKYHLNLLGPNCMGFFNTAPGTSFNGTFSPTVPNPGNIAFISQSGALGVGIMELAVDTDLGFSLFVSTGNKSDINDNDILEYLYTDPNTHVIAMYLESIDQPEIFRNICRKITAVKPILAVKAGRTESGLRAASSHTGALANPEYIVDGFLKQCGIIRKNNMKELFDSARVLTYQDLPKSSHIAVVTNAGGPSTIASDAIEKAGLELARLSKRTSRKLKKILPVEASVENPVDMIASADHNTYHDALEIIIEDDAVDAVLLIIVRPPVNTTPRKIAQTIEALIYNCAKPIIAIVMSRNDNESGLKDFKRLNIPVFKYPDDAVRAMATLWEYQKIQQRFRRSETIVSTRKMGQTLISGRGAENNQVPLKNLIELLESYDIKCAPNIISAAEENICRFQKSAHDSIVLKIANEQIIHKTETGLLKLNINTKDELLSAMDELKTKANPFLPADVKPLFLAQQQVKGGVELVLGGKRDSQFGPVIMVGIGGIFVEVLKDVSFKIAPVNAYEAKEMLSELRSQALLNGFRGQPPVDRDAFGYTIQQFSLLLAEHPEIVEIDLNPLIWAESQNKAIAVDIRAKVK
ncbi:MAG: acetate--CoA ligase family protein [Calditrichaceae bacterium]|nr:acetate--CoA ligase family protein [Calditrichaceae bacterium]